MLYWSHIYSQQSNSYFPTDYELNRMKLGSIIYQDISSKINHTIVYPESYYKYITRGWKLFYIGYPIGNKPQIFPKSYEKHVGTVN